MNEIEKVSISLIELKRIVSQIDFDAKNSLISKKSSLKYILFESTNYFNSSKGIKLFEEKFNIFLSEKLKKVIEIFTTKGFYHCELFDHEISYNPIDCFFSLEFVKILIQNGLSKEEIENGYFDHENQSFSANTIEEVYNKLLEKENLLIYCIPFSESCGGRGLLILNGNDENIIAYDHHCSTKEIIYNEETYNYMTYLLHEKKQTIFDMIFEDIDNIKKLIEPYKTPF